MPVKCVLCIVDVVKACFTTDGLCGMGFCDGGFNTCTVCSFGTVDLFICQVTECLDVLLSC